MDYNQKQEIKLWRLNKKEWKQKVIIKTHFRPTPIQFWIKVPLIISWVVIGTEGA